MRSDEARVAGNEERAWVGVLALVGRHDDRWVGVGTLHSLLHIAGGIGATVVAPT